MKILHTSDWHLGIELHKHPLLADQRYFLSQLKQIILEKQVDVILISGDIYDTTLASKEAIDIFNEAMRMLCMELKKEVIVIAGNHDSQTRLASLRDLLDQVGLHIYGKVEGRMKPLTIQNVDFFAIPYFHKDTIAQIYGQKFPSYEAAMACMMDDIRAQKGSHKQVVLAHCFVNGASICESDRFAMVGGSDVISKDVFQQIDYTALGHLHTAQVFDDVVRYSGTPLPYSFSETNDKCVWLIDSETMEIEACPIVPLHPLKILEGTYDEVIAQLPLYQKEYVKVVLTDQSVSYELLSFMRERCPLLLTLRGKQASLQLETQSIHIGEMDDMSDEDIVRQFFKDYFDKEVSEEEMRWFAEAKMGDAICV